MLMLTAYLTTWWFWIVTAEVLCLFWLLAYDRGTAATFSLLVFAALLYFVGDVDIVSYVKDNPKTILYGAAVYFPVGTLWALFKWFLLVLDRKTQYKEDKLNWLRNHKLDIPANTPMNKESVNKGLLDEDTLKKWKEDYRWHSRRDNIPQVRDYKYNILRWVGYWPVSVIWTLISDFVRRISKAIYNVIQSWLQAISDKMFADIKADFER